MRFLLKSALHAVSIGSFLLISAVAEAAPPSSCANKFIGTWGYPGGTTVIAPNGIAYPKCFMCVAAQTWTCQGNTYLFSNTGPPGQFSATLSSDGRQLIGGGVVANRLGGAAVAKPVVKKLPQSNSAKLDKNAGSNDPSPGDVDAKQCVAVLPGKSAGTWKIYNRCPYGIQVGYRFGSQKAANYIGPKNYDAVINKTEPRIISACAKNGRNCR